MSGTAAREGQKARAGCSGLAVAMSSIWRNAIIRFDCPTSAPPVKLPANSRIGARNSEQHAVAQYVRKSDSPGETTCPTCDSLVSPCTSYVFIFHFSRRHIITGYRLAAAAGSFVAAPPTERWLCWTPFELWRVAAFLCRHKKAAE